MIISALDELRRDELLCFDTPKSGQENWKYRGAAKGGQPQDVPELRNVEDFLRRSSVNHGVVGESDPLI